MRQRAGAAVTPPRSAESDHGQWQHHHQPRQRSSYQSSSADSRYLEVPGHNGGDGMEAAATTTTEGATRRRRTLANQTNQFHHQSTTAIERHSPQHYMAEYNKNYGVVEIGASGSAESITTSAPHSAGSGGVIIPAAPYSSGAASYTHHGATGYSSNHAAAASEIYYNQYGNHHEPQQNHHHHHQNYKHHSASASSSYDENNNNSNVVIPLLRRNNSVPNAHKLSFQHFEKSFHIDPNPLAAVHFRKALHVPDSQYREFLHGHGRDNTPVLNPICCANTCAGFSFVGFIFLVFIGILLDTQPLFINGTLPTAIKEYDGGKTAKIFFVTAERLPQAANAYQASYAYLATMLACLLYVYYERLDSMLKRRAYQDIPDAASLAGTSTTGVVGGGGESGAGGVLPEVNTAGAGDPPAYHVSTWNRLSSATFTVRVREWAGAAAARVWNGRRRGAPNNPLARRKARTKTCAKTV